MNNKKYLYKIIIPSNILFHSFFVDDYQIKDGTIYFEIDEKNFCCSSFLVEEL